MTVYSGVTASIFLANGDTFSSVGFDENLVDTDSGVRKKFTLATGTARLTKRFWDSTATTKVYVNGVEQTDYTTFSIQWLGGVVTFANPIPGGQTVRVTGKYIAVTQVATATEWQLQIQRALADASILGDTWKMSFPMQKSGTLSFAYLQQTSTDYQDYFTSASFPALGLKLIVMLWVTRNSTTGTGFGYVTYARINSSSMRASNTELEKPQQNLEAYGKVYEIHDI